MMLKVMLETILEVMLEGEFPDHHVRTRTAARRIRDRSRF
jgi:hypothetical protein